MISLGQLSVGRELSFWLNYRPGIYYFNFDGNYPLIDSAFLVDVPTISGVTSVGAVFSDSTQLLQASSIAELDDGPSFYYDSTANMLYIRLQNYDPPDIHQISGGPIYGFAKEPYIDPATGTEYESRLISSVGVTRKKDALFFNSITYSDFDIELSNADGSLYDIQNWDVYGQPVSLFYGEETQPVSSFKYIRTGRVKEYTFRDGVLNITVQDSRRVLTKNLPVNTVNLTAYPNADRDKNKSIPVVYGQCRRVPARATDDGTATTSFSFIVADCADHSNGIKSIDTVYVDGVTVTPTATNLTAGTFTLSSSDYEKGQTVTADIKGYVDGSGDLIENPLEILKDIFLVYLDIAYSTLNYDTTTWDNETTGKANVAYAAVSSTTIANIAEAFGSSLLSGLFITPEGKFTWLSHDSADAPVYQIDSTDWFGVPQIEFSSDEALSSATVEYDRNWNTGDKKIDIYDSGYDDFVLKFKRAQDQTFETVLVDDADAESFAELLGTSYGDVQILVSGVISLDLVNPQDLKALIDLSPGENIDASVANLEIYNGKVFRTQNTISRFKGELLELAIDPDSQTAGVKLRYIETYDVFTVDGDPFGDFILGYSFLAETGVKVVV